jgi:hypothetical protein
MMLFPCEHTKIRIRHNLSFKRIEIAVVLKLTPILLESPEELRINERVKINVKIYVYSSVYVPNARLNIECPLLVCI